MMNSGPPPLEVWLVDLHRCAAALQALEATSPRLSDDENERAHAKGSDGVTWRVQRIALRILLERHVGPEVRGIAFAAGPKGKPQLAWPSDIHFSVSDSGPYGLLAIARGGVVGVDIEQPRAVRFSEARRSALVSAAAGICEAGMWPSGVSGQVDDDATVLQAWVRLEAWAKARGTGIGALLTDLGIWGAAYVRGSGASPEVRVRKFAQHEGISVSDLRIPQNLQGAVACASPSHPIIVREFPVKTEALVTLLEP